MIKIRHIHNYKDEWLDSRCNIVNWKNIDNEYLLNIIRKIKRQGFGPDKIFPGSAYFYACNEGAKRGIVSKPSGIYLSHNYNSSEALEIIKQNFAVEHREKNKCFIPPELEKMYPKNPSESFEAVNCRCTVISINMSNDNDVAEQAKIADSIWKSLIKENDMRKEDTQNTEAKSAEVKMVPESELPNYFGKKVEFQDGNTGTVVAIQSKYGVNEGEIAWQLKVRVKGQYKDTFVHSWANQVRIIPQVKFYAYEHKDGTLEHTSKEKSEAAMKRAKMIRRPGADKMVDI